MTCYSEKRQKLYESFIKPDFNALVSPTVSLTEFKAGFYESSPFNACKRMSFNPDVFKHIDELRK
jgi:hypothetical protein